MPKTNEAVVEEIDRIVRSGKPNTRAIVCATDADREALLSAQARRVEAAGHRMMKVVPPAAADIEAAERLDAEIRQTASERNVLLVIDRAHETLPESGTIAQCYLFPWDVQRDLPVLLLMVGGDGLLDAMVEADLDRHFGYRLLYWPWRRKPC